jgi:type I restriction enzyme S subunit
MESETNLYQLPKGWIRTKVGNIFEFAYGKGLVKSARKETGSYPVYGSNGVVGFHDGYVTAGPKVIIGRKGAAGAVHYCNENCWPIDTTYFINSINVVDSKFSYYLLKSLRLNQFETSTAIPGLNRDDAYRLDILLPPLPEQKRIVAKIEELFSELDNGIAALKTAREQLKVYRQAVLKHAFEGKLTAKWREENNGDSWRLEKLGNLIVFLTSGSRGWAKYYSDSGDIFIRAQNLKYDRLNFDDKAFVSLPEKTEGKRTQVQPGDILITITGANVTKTGRVCTDIGTAYVSQHVALCRPSDDIDSEFMYWFLVAEPAGRRQLTKFAYGAGKPGLNLDNIRSVEINLPPISEQRAIVKQIKELLSIEEKVFSDIATELQRVELLCQSILKKAFSGNLVQQDSSDEPASKLLERIKAEKVAQVMSKTNNKKRQNKDVNYD